MLVSVVIPCYNNANLLAKTLAGFAVQEPCTYKWEVIAVDNNSDDESIASVHRQFRAKLPLTLIQQTRLPHPFALCKARNNGIRLARGDWIISMDADTIPNTTYLKTLGIHLKKWGNTPVIATGERTFISTNDVEPDDILKMPSVLTHLPAVASPSNYGLPQDRRLPVMKQLPDVEHPWDYIHGCNAIYRRADALSVGGYQEAYDGQWGFEDIDFAYRMITEARCTPRYAAGLHLYHQDLPGDKPQANRNDKSANPNWARICDVIPGYKDYKTAKYRKLSDSIKV